MSCREIIEQPGDRRQPAFDRRCRQPGLTIDQPDHLGVTTRALRLDEPQHVGRPDLQRRLAHHSEEHLHIEGLRQQVFGRQRAATNRRYSSSKGSPNTEEPRPARAANKARKPSLDRTRFGGHLTRLLQFLSTGD